LNISLLIDKQISAYNTLYYLSGYIFPLILFLYSLTNLTHYQFNSIYKKDSKKGFQYIFYIIFPILIIFSILITKYYLFLFSKIINAPFNFLEFNKFQFIIILIFSVLLLIKKTKKIVKILYLIYYLINFTIYWTINTYPFNIPNTFYNDNYINNYLTSNSNFNYINIIILFILEILFFLWSYVSHKNNISDWYIPIPQKSSLYPLVNILIFYFGLIVYFYIFKNL